MQPESWKAVMARVQSDLAALLRQNQAFFAARGAQAVDERNKLAAAVDQFDKERIPEVEDASVELNEASRRKVVEYVRQLRRLSGDFRTKEFEGALTVEGLSERYRLSTIQQEIAVAASKPK